MKQVYFCKLQLFILGCSTRVLVKANTLAEAENWAQDQAIESAEAYGCYYDSDAAMAFVELYDPEKHDSKLNQWALENIREI